MKEKQAVEEEGFACDQDATRFTFNRDPVDLEYPKLLPHDEDSASKNECFLRLTPDEANPRATSAFMNFTFASGNVDKVFSTTAGYKVYGVNEDAGDGMTFVVHQDPRGLNALGGSGGSMGVYQRYNVEGIKPALVVEWDTRTYSRLMQLLQVD